MKKLESSRLALNALVLVMLGACAGGGGGGGNAPILVSPPPPPPVGTPFPAPLPLPPLPPGAAPGSFPSSSSQEFQNNWGPGGISAQSAWQYQNGHGEGVLIGVIDDGIDPTHPELVGRIDTVNSVDIVPGRNALTTTLSHGSELSSLMVGNFNGAQTVGVAYGARVLAIRADNGAGGFNSNNLAAAVNYAVASGVDLINFSLGSSSPSSPEFQAALSNATANGVIVVASAGNDGPFATQPIYPGFLATDAAIGKGLILIAGGTNPDGSFNTRSNVAGSAANSYLVAPGWEILVPDFGPAGAVPGFQECGLGPNGDLCRIQGTSYASPHVTAAAAIIMSAFPGLTPQQVVQVILQSTNDLGVTGIDSTYGWGSLNLARAFQPIGTVAAPLTASTSATPLTPLGEVGPAFGDGFDRQTAAWTVAGFDAFGRTFDIDLSRNWLRREDAWRGVSAEAPALWRRRAAANGAFVDMAFDDGAAPESLRPAIDDADRLRDAMRVDFALAPGLSGQYAHGGAQVSSRLLHSFAGIAQSAGAETSVSLSKTLGDAARIAFTSASGEGPDAQARSNQVTALTGSLNLGVLALDLTAGRLSEAEGVLGLRTSSTFGAPSGGETQYLNVAGRYALQGPWAFAFSAESGEAELGGAWLRVSDPLRTSAFALELQRDLGDWGGLSFALSQPLRVESGAVSFAAPAADQFGLSSLRYEERSIDPAPSGRELRLGAFYRYAAGDAVSFSAGAVLVSDPGHIADADDAFALSIGLRAQR